MRQGKSGLYRNGGKRLLDLLLTLPLLVATAPLQLMVMAIVRLRLGSPVFFRQERPGRYAEPFEMVKYRTMTDEHDHEGHPKPDAERLTSLGRFLRSTSLDELPELYNVLKGDMSLIGPRPLLMSYLGRYTPHQARRHEVRPGITGWAQVTGRNRISWEEKFTRDLYYVDHISLRLDLRILWLTAGQVWKRADTTAIGHASAPEFFGSPGPIE